MKHLISFMICACLVAAAAASDVTIRYRTCENGFLGFLSTQASAEDTHLVLDNATAAEAITVDTTVVSSYKFKIMVRMANAHNVEGKAYKVLDMEKKPVKVSHPQWGVVFNYADSCNYDAVVLWCDNTAPHDMLDKRQMHYALRDVTDGQVTVLEQGTLTDGVNVQDGDNSIMIDYNGELTTVSLGRDRMKQIASLSAIRYHDCFRFGLLLGAASRLKVERVVEKYVSDPSAALRTDWTAQSLQQHLAHSRDDNEGYWEYYDRDLDEARLKLGGHYVIATVKGERGYDIIYVSGAKVLPQRWRTGMLKGVLINTMFEGEYDMVWYDAECEPLSEDVSASFADGGMLVMHFPRQKGSMRFAKKFGR